MVELVETPLAVLIVCTGNICRSPLAEQLLQTALTTAGIPATVSSAGTHAMVGHPMTQEAAALALRHGAPEQLHSARQLTPDLIKSADLVLTATREHRSEVVSLHPRASRYAYTLNQFARLVAAAPVVEPVETKELVETPMITSYLAEIAATKGLTPPPANPTDDDIEDPYRRSAAMYNRVAEQIAADVTTITKGLATTAGGR